MHKKLRIGCRRQLCFLWQPVCTLGGVIETTGAGDTFCASVLNFVLKHSLDQMLRFANTAAYLVTTKKGAIRSMPDRKTVEETMRRAAET